MKLRLETAVETLRRDLDVEPEAAMAAEPPELAEGVTPTARARELERELRLMGPINPLALQEYDALQERHTFLQEQLDDVKSSRRDLAKVIRAIDAEIVDVFAGAFADVSQNFEALFQTLFPGGQGRLRLTTPDDLLQTGIEVEAKPSGKNVRKLSLLSGGERSLTALAFLFAVFRSRPSPFYVMDEVEAALDDVNLHRFLDLVHEFRQEAQLLIVSHQKRTMEAADVLYGVTMQPGGSSKVVSERRQRTRLTPSPASSTAAGPSNLLGAMELVLIAVLVVLVLAGAGLVVTRRKRDDLRGRAADRARRRRPPAPAEITETLDEPAPPREEAPPVVEAPAPAVEAPPVKPRFRDRLGKARGAVSGYLGSVLSREKVEPGTWDDLEEALIVADVGVTATTDILDRLRATVDADGHHRARRPARRARRRSSRPTSPAGDRTLHHEPGAPNVWLFVGVNGVGKTTTIGKVGKRQAEAGHSVVMAAGDTFRAAAAEQLETWAERAGADLVRGAEGGDPSSVIFDAVQRAAARGADLVLADTAGRLHTKVNLMDELRKVRRVADREPGKVTEVLLVLDATTGQNGLVQAQQFTEAVDLTGVVLTKLDGSAKGGIAFAIQSALGIPIKLVGLGETVDGSGRVRSRRVRRRAVRHRLTGRMRRGRRG